MKGFSKKFYFILPLLFLLGVGCAPSAPKDSESPSESTPVVTGKYLLTFHACDASIINCRDPRNHQVYLAQGDEGLSWNLVPGWRPFKGSVPDVIRRGDILYIMTARNELVRYHVDTNTQEDPVPVTIEGVRDGFVDPSLFIDEDGRLVLFFLYGMRGGDPAGCRERESTCVKRFGSATEVSGTDGAKFTLDEGDRAAISLSSGLRSASDPDIFFDGEKYVLYISYGPSVSVWTSSELRGAYTEINTKLSNQSGGIPAGFFEPESGQYWTYVHQPGPGKPAVIRRAVSDRLTETIPDKDWQTVLSGASVGLGSNFGVESPGFAVNK